MLSAIRVFHHAGITRDQSTSVGVFFFGGELRSPPPFHHDPIRTIYFYLFHIDDRTRRIRRTLAKLAGGSCKLETMATQPSRKFCENIYLRLMLHILDYASFCTHRKPIEDFLSSGSTLIFYSVDVARIWRALLTIFIHCYPRVRWQYGS